MESGQTSVQALASIAPNTFGAQPTLVMLVNFQDKPTQPYTLDHACNVDFTTTSDFFLENSFQQTWLIGDVVGWFTIPLDSTMCEYSKLASYAKQAASAAGVNLSAYKRYVYGFPKNTCSWWGLGSVGGNPSQAWINGRFQLRVVGHEMGHNFVLYHSHALDCGTTTLGTNCTTSDYGDTLDIMGTSSGHFNAFQKERMGWLDYSASPPIITVQGDGTYSLDAYEVDGSVSNALKSLKLTNPKIGKRTWYCVESHKAIGFDSFLSSNGNVLNGAVIRTGSEASGNSSYLLEMTPETASWSDPALVVGKSFYNPDVGFTIAPLAVNSAGTSVAVSIGPQACARANPAVALSPA
ncbi:MAG TPA: hypothetical protein VLK82_24795 [Candidatus Tectomicrobia bacterium]|nr:hypothetical protein [Candidatus Tectomicrobia bacterium]